MTDRPVDTIGEGERMTSGTEPMCVETDALAARLTTLERCLLLGEAKGWGSWMVEVAAGLTSMGLMDRDGGSFHINEHGQAVADHIRARTASSTREGL